LKVDSKLVEKCYKRYREACELLEKIEEAIHQFCEENNIELLFREDTFEPFWGSEEGYFMQYYAVRKSNGKYKCGDVLVLKDGTIVWQEESES